MTYHGGVNMPSVTSKAIFWGPSWTTATYPGDKISSLDSFYAGIGGSGYAATSDEYTGSNGKVGSALSYGGHVTDGSATPRRAPSTSEVLAEVAKVITRPDPSGNGYYPVYTDLRRGHAGYCAWHSSGLIGNTRVQFAFFFDLTGDPGCDPGDTVTNHSQGLSALANISAHEVSEAQTDPASPGAWYYNSGAENGDKCAWTFAPSTSVLSNGSTWRLQGEFSNAANAAKSGYDGAGCISG